MTHETDDLRIESLNELSSPKSVREEIPISDEVASIVYNSRLALSKILDFEDDRLILIVGPCSIHDPIAALEYAAKLKVLQEKYKNELMIIMRVYFEKPRTTVGWKGLINDPDLDGSFKINKGIRIGRDLLYKINEMGLGAGTEYLDLISPQYISDLISWGAIGARTTESQCHRELASGLSCPVGFKNGTSGDLQIAIDAIGSSSMPHNFLSVTKEGNSAIFTTIGNEYCHVILRGGKTKTNFDKESINLVSAKLDQANLPVRIMVDCSHANSRKDHKKQIEVANDIATQISTGEDRIIGVMIESNLVEGNQKVDDIDKIQYGKSITDACIGWEDTENVIDLFSKAIKKRRKNA